ncbi:MAG: hypothetical protein WCX31_08345 [Salinivirgaceae bacterium]
MTFGVDKQTKVDLNIFAQSKEDFSVFDLFNHTETKGGKDVLEKLMDNPLSNLTEINNRVAAIKFISNHKIQLVFDKERLDFIEYYLNLNTKILHNNFVDSAFSWFKNQLKPSNDYYIISRGLEYFNLYVQSFSLFTQTLNQKDIPEFFEKVLQAFEEFESISELKSFSKLNHKKISFRQLGRYDCILRKKEKEKIKTLLNLTYQMDALISVSKALIANKLSFSIVKESAIPQIEIEGFFHPFLENPVLNTIRMDSSSNLCFVTGANMAGKSTFLKSVGLCMYLSHIGFPVPAKTMKTTLFNGLFSIINIADNIKLGYSHYFSEVKRVKKIALMIKEKKRVFVIFDELFRGTNVRDAYDASLLITSGFIKIKASMFFISTHIVEIGQELEKQEGTMFKCFSAQLQDGIPIYDYKLLDGISSERLGLAIVKNEEIMEIIDEIVNESQLNPSLTTKL